MDVSEALALISGAIDAGKAANGYLVCGDLGRCLELVDGVLAKLFPGAERQIGNRTHPDIAWIEPEGAKRIIAVKAMREKIVDKMEMTSFSGGWKAGIIVGADRMEAPSANAFLKSLEEPRDKTIFLMATDSPDAILPTIVSRSQRIFLAASQEILGDGAYGELAEIFGARGIDGVWAKAAAGRRMNEILEAVIAEAEDETATRKAFYRTLLSFARKWMVDGSLDRAKAYRNIEAIEEAYRQRDSSLKDETILSLMADRIEWPEDRR